MKLTNTYYKLPLSNIPFQQIPTLELMSCEFIYCSSFPLMGFMGVDFHLMSVYDTYDDQVFDFHELKERELLFGKVISGKLSTRGPSKCLKIGSVEVDVIATMLPDLKYSANVNCSSHGNWFFMREGKYMLFSSIKSEFESVRHLEGVSVYGDSIIRLRVVIELLKKNVKQGKVELSIEDFKNVAYTVLKSDPALGRADEDMLKSGVDIWVPGMLSTPLYEEVPNNIRGKAIV
jgi:hypothetical protein